MKREFASKKLVFAFAVMAVALWLGSPLALADEPSCSVGDSNAYTNVDAVDTTESDKGGQKIHTIEWRAQTFTVEGSGCLKLNAITFSVRRQPKTNGQPVQPSDLVVEIHNVSNGVPGTAATDVLASHTIPLFVPNTTTFSIPTTYTDFTVAFSPAIEVTGGVQYALVVHQPSGGGSGTSYYSLGLATGNLYTGGQYCRSNDSGATWDGCPQGAQGGPDVRMWICVSTCTDLGCTLTQGFWKTHGPIPTGNNEDEWPVESLTLGTVSYTDFELLSILNTPPAGGNALVSLAHQLIAAKLNVANGAFNAAASAIAAADTMIGSLVIPPIGGGFIASGGAITSLTGTLDLFNNGWDGVVSDPRVPFPGWPPHCDDQEPEPEIED